MTGPGTWPDADAVHAATTTAARNAAASDVSGALASETVQALAEAGFPGCFVPEQWGGLATTLEQTTQAVAAVGEGCASAAWLASLWAYNGRFGSYLPSEGQEEVWAKGPDTRLVSSMVAAGVTVDSADGGWTLSGSWHYVSGVQFADWALVSSALPREGDRSVLVFAVPRESFTHRETWSTVGMRATGSHLMVVNGAFVPRYRAFRWDDMRQGILPASATNAQAAPLFAVNGLTFAAPVLGAARGALRLTEDYLAGGPSGPRAAAWESNRIAFTQAAAEIDAAGLLLSRVAGAADLGELADGLAERNHRDSTFAVRLLVQAVGRLCHVAGTRGLDSSHGIQRIWRDVHTAASHAAVQFEPAALAYTRGLMPAQ